MSKNEFFKRKSNTIDIPEPGPFVEDSKIDIEACGLEAESFKARNLEMFGNGEGFGIEKDKNPVASVVQRLEKYFSKREIAFLLAKDMLHTAYNEAKEKEENGK